MDTTWRTILRYALLLVAVSTTIGPRAGAQQPRADLILVNGRVLTVDANDRVAQAVAISGNRIIAVGSTAEVERAAGPTRDASIFEVTPSRRDCSTPTRTFPAAAAIGCSSSTSAIRT